MHPEPYLSDTNILIHLVRNDALGQQIKTHYDLLMTETTPAYCVVSEGEVRSLAYQWNWGQEKLEQMTFLLDYFRRLPIEPASVIAAYSKSIGIIMGKNDVWIAAVAHTSGFNLLTTDHDFDHLHGNFIFVI